MSREDIVARQRNRVDIGPVCEVLLPAISRQSCSAAVISSEVRIYAESVTSINFNHVFATRRLSAMKQCILMLCLVSPTVCTAQEVSEVSDAQLRQQLVAVAPDVKLEVLDWDGLGRKLYCLRASGNTAHVYARFAPKLAQHFHVYGITRRGSGASSAPPSGYTARQLGEDVVLVLDGLRITDPVSVGHSIAGEEMSAVSKYHPGRASALVSLDAGGRSLSTILTRGPRHGSGRVARGSF